MEISQKKSNKLLFIAGPGRSGSTILELLLGQIDGFCPTGELRFIWKRSFAQNQLCGCGRPFKECDFWSGVVREAFGSFQNVNHERFEKLRISAEHKLLDHSLKNNSRNPFTEHKEYLNAYREIHHAIRKISGCEYIIDSSKNAAHGFLISAIPNLDLHTVHLVRDSRAVAYSWQRQKLRPEVYWEQRFMSKRGILKSTKVWNSRNALAQKLQPASKAYTSIRYEDLTQNPKDKLSGLLTNLGIHRNALGFLDGYHAKLKTGHTVSGNPVRFVTNEIIIKSDAQWKNKMSGHHKFLVTLLTWPLLQKHGYLGNSHFK